MDPTEVVRQFLDSFNSANPEAMQSVLAPDVVYEDVSAGRVMSGRDALLGFFEMGYSVAPGTSWVPEAMFAAEDNRVVVRATLSGSLKPGTVANETDDPIEMHTRTATIFRVEEGLISEAVDYYQRDW
jgi:steroid delta-isomerase-like uncharacterized protein